MTKLLVVDDNRQNRRLLQTLLMRNGYDVTLAGNGLEALEAARSNPPDLIISDILMPGMDGYALCRQWKRDEKLKEIPFVFYTATYTDPKDEQLALDMGADRFIRKPQVQKAFLDIINEAIEQHKAGRQTPPREPAIEEHVYFKQYNEALVRKLEDKLAELESVRASLECELAERKRAERLLQENEERFQELFDHMGDGVAVYAEVDEGNDFVIVDLNTTGETLSRVRREEVIGRRVTQVFPAVTQIGLLDVFRRVWRTGQPEQHPLSKYADGRIEEWVENYVFKLPSGPIVAIYSDTSAIRKAEEALREQERQYHELVQNVNSAIVRWKRDGTVAFFNEYAQSFFGYSADEIIGKHVGILVPETESSGADLSTLVQDVVDFPDRYINNVNENICRDGRRVWMTWTNKPVRNEAGDVVEILAIGADITDRKRAEDEVARVALDWQQTFDSTNSAVWILDRDRRVVRANKTSQRMFHHSPDALIGKHCWEIIHGTDAPISECPMLRARDSLQRECQDLQIGDAWFEITVDPIFDARGQYQGAVHAANDITERKRAEHALALHGQRVQALLDLQLLSNAQEDQVLDFVLDACLSMTQSEHSFIGAMNETESVMTVQRWSKGAIDERGLSIRPIEYPIRDAGLWGDCVRKRAPVICNDCRAPNPSKKGLPEVHVPVHRFIAVPALDGDRVVLVAVVANKNRDYTTEDADALSTILNKMWEILSRQRRKQERDTLEEQYRQAQKMEAIGQLAGGVAHDFNNILQAMVGYSGMLLDRLPEHDETHEFAEEIARGAERAAVLTRQLLAFSRRQVLEMEDLECAEVIHGVTKMIRRIIGENIEVKVVDDPARGIIHADRGQMEQVLLNLCINARDAMPEGGALVIRTESVALDTEYCESHVWASPGRYMLLSITDNGCGMDAATQTRIFEPFFTTKEPGKGTGLGLATVYGIVRQHGGMVQLYSEVGRGTTFKVYLPRIEGAVATVGVKLVERARGGAETILVAEDDEALRKLALRILESGGYKVLLAADGEEAVDLFGKHAAAIDLALLDVVMPKMGGKAVYDVLHRQDPNLRFLFSSGYSMDAVYTSFVLHDGIELILKPYGPNELLSKVREVLDRTLVAGTPE